MNDTKLHLGIEAGDVLLKVALYDPSEKKILKAATLETGTSPLDDVPSFEAALQGWLAEDESIELGTVSLTVSSFRSIVRQVFVPPEATDISDYLRWYLRSIINTEVDSYFLDFQILNGDAKFGHTVLLIAMRRVWVDAIRKGFRNKRIAPKILEVDVISILNLLEVGFDLSSELQCVIKADVSGVMLMWASAKNLQALRCCSTLELVGKSREEAYAQLANSIVEQIHLAAEVNGASTTHIRLCGELASDILFVESLRSVASNYTLSLMDSFSNIRLPVDEQSVSHILSCAGAIGVALRGGNE